MRAARRIQRHVAEPELNEPSVPEGPGKVVEAPHYVTRWQLWSVVHHQACPELNVPLRDERNHKWNPFDPDSIPRDIPMDYPNARFIINVRHKKPYDEPELVLSDFSKPIIAFMRYVIPALHLLRELNLFQRAAVGNQFFNEKPECPVVQLFIAMKNIRQKQACALALAKDEQIRDMKEVENLGYIEATKR
jgi:hypothetical protein